ncbi:hypothetical protein [Spirosoma koreense]
MTIDQQTIILLYTFLRQADLSIDRVRWTSWKELAHFYQDKLKPTQVINILDSTVIIEASWLERIIQHRAAFKPSEYEILRATLLYYQELLDQSDPATVQIETCSLWIKYLTYTLLEPYLSRNVRDRCMSPEHYLENPAVKTYPLEELVDIQGLIKTV